jgi:hypothetical protein
LGVRIPPGALDADPQNRGPRGTRPWTVGEGDSRAIGPLTPTFDPNVTRRRLFEQRAELVERLAVHILGDVDVDQLCGHRRPVSQDVLYLVERHAKAVQQRRARVAQIVEPLAGDEDAAAAAAEPVRTVGTLRAVAGHHAYRGVGRGDAEAQPVGAGRRAGQVADVLVQPVRVCLLPLAQLAVRCGALRDGDDPDLCAHRQPCGRRRIRGGQRQDRRPHGQQAELPADYETSGMARLRREAHARMLGNGLCTRPVELDCRMESACETCAYFRTTVEFLPILTRQRDHARERGQADRAELFDKIIGGIDDPPA